MRTPSRRPWGRRLPAHQWRAFQPHCRPWTRLPACTAVHGPGSQPPTALPCPSSSYPPRRRAPITVARIAAGGDWYANATGLPNLIKQVNASTRSSFALPPSSLAQTASRLPMPCHRPRAHRSPEAERRNLRAYSGGFIHVDDNYGSTSPSARGEEAAAGPDLVLLPFVPDLPRLLQLPRRLAHIHDTTAGHRMAMRSSTRAVVLSYHTTPTSTTAGGRRCPQRPGDRERPRYAGRQHRRMPTHDGRGAGMCGGCAANEGHRRGRSSPPTRGSRRARPCRGDPTGRRWMPPKPGTANGRHQAGDRAPQVALPTCRRVPGRSSLVELGAPLASHLPR